MNRFDRSADYLAEVSPALRRAVSLDPAVPVRLRVGHGRATALLRLPFGVLAARGVATSAAEPLDVTVRAGDLLAWLDATTGPGAAEAPPPQQRDADWRWALPPAQGWRRLDTVPGDVVQSLVRSGARALAEAADREGVPGAEPRAEVTDALLDSVVLTVTADEGAARAEITLRLLAALTRLGFAPGDSPVSVDLAGRWIRVTGRFGSVYTERPGSGLSVLGR